MVLQSGIFTSSCPAAHGRLLKLQATPTRRWHVALSRLEKLLHAISALLLDDRVISLSDQLGLHRIRLPHVGEGANLHMVELVVVGGIIHHKDVVLFLAQRARQSDGVVLSRDGGNLHDHGSWTGHRTRAGDHWSAWRRRFVGLRRTLRSARRHSFTGYIRFHRGWRGIFRRRFRLTPVLLHGFVERESALR